MPSENVVIGLLLDLEVGTFSAYQTGCRDGWDWELPDGTLLPDALRAWHRCKTNGISGGNLPLSRFPAIGEGYRWGVCFGEPYDSVRIASVPIPAIVLTLHAHEVAAIQQDD